MRPIILTAIGASTIPKAEAGIKITTRKCTKPGCKRRVVKGCCWEHRRQMPKIKAEDLRLIELSKQKGDTL